MLPIYITMEKQETDNEWSELYTWGDAGRLQLYLDELKSKQGAMIKIFKVDLEIGQIKEVKKLD